MKVQSSFNTVNSFRLIVTTLGNVTLAYRIETVYKVVKRSQIPDSNLEHSGIIHINGEAAVIVDLHRTLFNAYTPSEQGYFVVVKSRVGELIAVPVETSPNLMDVSREHVRVLPSSYRQANRLTMASHVAVVPYEKETLTIFIIDENSLLPSVFNT